MSTIRISGPRRTLAMLAGLYLLCFSAVAPHAQYRPEVAFKAATDREVMDGDLKGAIEEYKKVVAAAGANRALAAQALLKMAEAYQKLGDAQAPETYSRLVRDYADQRDAAATARARLATQAAGQDAIVLRKVWTGEDASAISSDGRYLTYPGNFYTALFLHDLTTGADRPLTNGDTHGTFGSTISEEGTQVAYNWCMPGESACEVRVASLLGTGVPTSRRVFANDEVSYIEPMDWSTDGKWIAASVRRKDRTAQIGLVSVSDGVLRVLKSVDWRGPTTIFFSPDGRDIAFDLPVSETSADRDVFVLAADGSREIPAVVHAGNDIVMGWSPDGRHLLFASDRSGTMGLWAQGVAERALRGTPTLVKPDIGNVSPLGITRTGALHMQARSNEQDIAVASIDLATGKETVPAKRPIERFTGTNRQPAWSPDGKLLAYTSRRGDDFVVGIRSMETSDIRELQLRPMLRYPNGLTWEPGGQSLVVIGSDLKGRPGIFRINTQSGEVTLIAAAPDKEPLSYEGFFWSPDRKRMYYHSQNGAIRERDLTADSERIVVPGVSAGNMNSGPAGRLGPISLSPDGQWIASYRTDESTRSVAVVLVPVNGGEPRELLRVNDPYWVNNTLMPWTPDGRGILVRKMTRETGETSELWLVPIDGTAARKLDFDVNRVAPYAQGKFQLHPDGRQVAFVEEKRTDAVWVLERFLPALNVNH